MTEGNGGTMTRGRKPYPAPVGLVWGMLTVIADASPEKGKARCVVRCECGTEKTIRTNNLWSGNTSNCGCVRLAKLREYNKNRPRKESNSETSKSGHKDECSHAEEKSSETSKLET